MRILIACEFSGIVREAFVGSGHDVWSCDLIPTEIAGQHIRGDVMNYLDKGWDMMIAHPPCTYLASSGARWWKDRLSEQRKAIEFVRRLMDAPIEKIAIENPIGKLSTAIRKPDQIIQPWQFGHGETKATCLWLKNLPLLRPTFIVDGRLPKVHWASGWMLAEERRKFRSRTYPGIAEAMAEQWG